MANLKGEKINIDEHLAEIHIMFLKTAIKDINDCVQELNPDLFDDNLMSGAMRSAVARQLNDIRKKLITVSDTNGLIIDSIKKIVRKYQDIDKKFAGKS